MKVFTVAFDHRGGVALGARGGVHAVNCNHWGVVIVLVAETLDEWLLQVGPR